MEHRKSSCVFYVHGKRRYRVYQRENHKWYADYEDKGLRKRISLRAATRPEAEAVVKEMDGIEAVSGTRRKDLSVTEMQAEFMNYCTTRELAPRSLDRYKAALDAFARFCAGKRIGSIASVTLKDLENFQVYRTKDEECDPKTVYADALVIKGMFKYASHPARGYAEKNPAVYWQVREPVKERPYCYTTKEVETLIAGCRDWLKPVLTTLALTGMRIGELINLRWEDVDLKVNLIHIRVREDWKPKGRSDRSLPMHPRVRDVILSRPVGKYVFLGPQGGRLKENRTLECFKEDRDRLGIHKGTLHTFRHFFISMCASSGAVPIATCMTWVGHKDTDMVWHYYHLSDTASQDAMVRMAAQKCSEFGTILAQLPVEHQNQVVETQATWLRSKDLQKLG